MKNKESKFKLYTLFGLIFLLIVLYLINWLFYSGNERGESINPITRPTSKVQITDSLIAKIKNSAESPNYFADYYKSANNFSNLADFIESGDKTGKLTKSVSSDDLINQLDELKDGEVLNIMAPVRVNSQLVKEDSYVQLFSLKKDGDKVTVDQVGEYWDVLQKNLEELRYKGNFSQTSEIENLLNLNKNKSNPETSYAIINKDGEDALTSPQGINTVGKILNDTSNVLSGEISQEKNQGNRAKETSLSNQVAELLADSQNDPTDQIAKILSSVIDNTGTLFLKSEDKKDNFATAEARCEKSGGAWFFESCNCPPNTEIGPDKYCHPKDKVMNNCLNSGGQWISKDDKIDEPRICGEREPESTDDLSNNYCLCPQNSCLNSDGSCNSDDEDSDKDGIKNADDFCPKTQSSKIAEINKDPGSDNYGCDCTQTGLAMEECPANKCIGATWVAYSGGEQECQNGKLLPYTCNYEEKGVNNLCNNPLENQESDLMATENSAESGENNVQNSESNGNNFPIAQNNSQDGNIKQTGTNSSSGNDVSSQGEFPIENNKTENNKNIDKNQDNSITTTPTDNHPNSSSGKGSAKSDRDKTRRGVIPGQALKNEYKPRDKTDWSKLLPTAQSNSGQNSYGSGSMGAGKAAGLKAALKRIYNQDYQTYKAIFTYLNYIGHVPGGGLCLGSGRIKVDYGAPYKILDQIVVHELAHCAQDATVGMDGFTRRELERIAVEKQIGSAHFEKPISTSKGTMYDLMKEFPSQRSQYVLYNGFEIRGYMARYWCKAHLQGIDCSGSEKGDNWNLGNHEVFLDWLNEVALKKFFEAPFTPAYAYEPKASQSGEYYYYGVEDGDANWGIEYATVSPKVPEPPDNTHGPYPYGFGKAELGAKQKEEDVIRTFMALSNQDIYSPCQSSPPPDLPPAYGCEGAPTIQLEGN